ncbi:MAG: hypothetical protein ACYC6B_09250 [Thermoleophilia bacterium]
MTKAALLILAAALFSSLSSGCTGQTKSEASGTTTVSLEEGAQLMREHVEGLQDEAYIAEEYRDSQYNRTYYQDGSGSWRLDSFQTDASSDRISAGELPPQAMRTDAIIYNAREAKRWMIVGTTAYETTDLNNEYESEAPITNHISAPKEGHYAQAGENGIWEWRVSPEDHARHLRESFGITSQPSGEESWNRYEFLGPEGLLSRRAAGPMSGGPKGRAPFSETTFEYSHIGDVPPELFELPPTVSEVKSMEEYLKQLRDSGWVPHEDRG